MAQKILTLNNGKIQRAKVSVFSDSGGTATDTNESTICKVTYSNISINVGETLSLALISDSITVDSIFIPSILQCESGYPIITKITNLVSERVDFEVLNVGGQGSGTEDILNKDLIINFIIL
jgi:hypothetical protein